MTTNEASILYAIETRITELTLQADQLDAEIDACSHEAYYLATNHRRIESLLAARREALRLGRKFARLQARYTGWETVYA